MSDDDEDISVMLFQARGKIMATREIALAMAEMLIPRAYGEGELEAQSPLKIEDGGDRWIIEGSRTDEDESLQPGRIHHGEAIVEISKSNCRVLKIARMAW